MANNNLSLTKISLFLMRISMGWLFLYAGLTKVFNPEWSAVGYLQGAKSFTGFYQWLLQPEILPTINFINQWGLTLLGLSLILGLFVRPSAILGAFLMLLYYFPVFHFPYAGAHSFIVNENIIYAVSLLLLSATSAGRFWGLDSFWRKLKSA